MRLFRSALWVLNDGRSHSSLSTLFDTLALYFHPLTAAITFCLVYKYTSSEAVRRHPFNINEIVYTFPPSEDGAWAWRKETVETNVKNVDRKHDTLTQNSSRKLAFESRYIVSNSIFLSNTSSSLPLSFIFILLFRSLHLKATDKTQNNKQKK